jgi:AcrR family transcriptional regulator
VGLAEVLREAGVSVGSFYARFDSKDALVCHLAERFWTRAGAEWKERLEPARWLGRPAAAILEGFVRDAVRGHRQHWSELRAFTEYALANPDARLLRHARQHDGTVIGLLRNLLLARRQQIRHPHPGLALELGYLQVVGTLRALILVGWPKTDQGAVPDESLVAELSRSLKAYLIRGT